MLAGFAMTYQCECWVKFAFWREAGKPAGWVRREGQGKHLTMVWLLTLSLAVGIAATVEDLWRRRVSNWLSGGGLLAGLAAHSLLAGLAGAADALLGALFGFAIFLIFFLLGGMGGGDVKLMAAFGAILGSDQILMAAFWAALVGGLIAAAFLAFKKLRGAVSGEASGRSARKEFIPYAPAISLGVLLSFLSEDELWTSVF